MTILITCPRAPVSIEWIKIAKNSRHEVILVDSLDYPISAFYSKTRYIKIPSPKINFEGYRTAIENLLPQCDLVIPNCEDLFYLSKVRDMIKTDTLFFMPEGELLFTMHHKYNFFTRLNSHVKFPPTKLLTCKNQIEFNTKTILKPVYSRFGRSVIRFITAKTIDAIDISPEYPWVQQAFIEGEPLCNYAVCEHGKVVKHVVYRPKYLLNQAASTYFEYHVDPRCEAFISEFAQTNHYHGQVAFDFIDTGKELYVLECNPRATSGLHLIADTLKIDPSMQIIRHKNIEPSSYRIGFSLYLLFGLRALWRGEFSTLHQDHKRAKDALKSLPWYSQFISFYEMVKRSIYFRRSLTTASTFDIEYDGERDV